MFSFSFAVRIDSDSPPSMMTVREDDVLGVERRNVTPQRFGYFVWLRGHPSPFRLAEAAGVAEDYARLLKLLETPRKS